jgi:hypothetical protein
VGVPPEDIQQVARAAIREGVAEKCEVRWEAVRPNIPEAPRNVVLRNWECFQGAVLTLVFSEGERHAAMGTAAMVAPGVAVSAAHTVLHFWPRMQRGEISITALGIRNEGAQMWHVQNVVYVEGTDICYLVMRYQSELPANRIFYQLTVTTRLPAVGERLVIAGFEAARDEFEQALPRTLELEGRMRATSGEVRQSFPRGRGDRLVPWPALEVDAPLYRGMSGGPVFDARGGIMGLGVRSFDMGPEEEPSPMVVALLWPVLGTPFPLADGTGPVSLLDLDQTYLQIERPDAVRIELLPDPPGGRVTHYADWT